MGETRNKLARHELRVRGCSRKERCGNDAACERRHAGLKSIFFVYKQQSKK